VSMEIDRHLYNPRFVLLSLAMRSNIYPMSFFDTAMFKVDSPLLL